MKLSSIGKFLDQPLLSNTLSRKMPHILAASAVIYGVKDTLSAKDEDRKKRAIKNAIILSSITAATLLGTKFIKIKGEKLIEVVKREDILKNQQRAIDTFKQNNKLSLKTNYILDKAKNSILSLKDTDTLLNSIQNSKGKEELIQTLFGNKKDITSKEILQEISKLSTLGFIPVASGILGGIAADRAVGENCKERTKNKIKEGAYQFLANIFLCNVGAGTALFTAEKLAQKGIIKKLSPLKKTGVILGGILSVGVLGGSHIANFIGNKVINPLVDGKSKKQKCQKICENRKPEPLDIALHSDDIATAGVLSGVKWIEPLLPVMYLISGYRTAIGYRNHDHKSKLDKIS